MHILPALFLKLMHQCHTVVIRLDSLMADASNSCLVV